MAPKNKISLIRALAQRKGLDPRAVLAVAAQEGLSGGVGDAGTSFGPFQLHEGGAFPLGIHGDRQSWAWSPQGLNYALSRIASVAAGLHGAKAVNAIVRRFERPAAPGREVAGALAAYGETGSPGGLSPGGLSAPLPQGSNPLLQAVLSGSSLLPVIKREYAGSPLQGPQVGLQGPLSPPEVPVASSGLLAYPAELLSEGLGGPTHSTGPHIHAAYTNPQSMLAAIRLAEKLGLHVGENPYVGDSPDPGVHAKHSYHYIDFPGLYNGRKLGEAIDVSGAKQAQFYKMLSKASGNVKPKS